MRKLIKKLCKSERGDVAVFAAITIPAVILIFLVLVSKTDLFSVKQELKYIEELAAKVATDTAVVMEDTTGNKFCVIFNDKDINRNNTWQQMTEVIYDNLSNPNNKTIKLGQEVIIKSVSTSDSENAYGWNRDSQTFDRPGNMRAINKYFQQGNVSINITGWFKPNYLPIPDELWNGYYFDISVSASCLA